MVAAKLDPPLGVRIPGKYWVPVSSSWSAPSSPSSGNCRWIKARCDGPCGGTIRDLRLHVLLRAGVSNHCGCGERPARRRSEYTETHKKCTVCGEWKLNSEFGERRIIGSRCRECHRRVSREDCAKVMLEGLLRFSPEGSTVPTCVCCGCTTLAFLQLDHIHDDGGKIRATINTGSNLPELRRLRAEGWPRGQLQTMCANCHVAKTKRIHPCPCHGISSPSHVL